MRKEVRRDRKPKSQSWGTMYKRDSGTNTATTTTSTSTGTSTGTSTRTAKEPAEMADRKYT